MNNVLERAIDCSDGDQAAKIIQDALGIESDEVANYVFPQTWPTDREQRARSTLFGGAVAAPWAGRLKSRSRSTRHGGSLRSVH